MNIVHYIMAFEEGEISEEAAIEMFQYLVNTGMIYSLQGSYQRIAHEMIAEGIITLPQDEN